MLLRPSLKHELRSGRLQHLGQHDGGHPCTGDGSSTEDWVGQLAVKLPEDMLSTHDLARIQAEPAQDDLGTSQ